MTGRPAGAGHLPALLCLIGRCRDAGAALPTTLEMAEQLGLSRTDAVTKLLRQGERRGHFRRVLGGAGILAIEAPDGSWRVPGATTAPRTALPKRRCLRCRTTFVPQHRHNFLCGCHAAEGIAI